MHGTNAFLTTFALVLCTAAVTTVVFQRLRQPVILGYLLAGLLVGPHVPLLPLIADAETTETLAELGVVLLLFSIGLEFSIRKLLRVGPSAGIIAVLDVSLMGLLGVGAARLLGWTAQESMVAGAMVAISSTTIIAKTFEDLGVKRKLRDLVFGVLIVEDLVAILILAAIASLGTGSVEGGMVGTVLRLGTLLTIWVIGGLLVVPRLMRSIVKMQRSETTLVASLGLCFAFALLARALGYSVALGAFIAGSLISESGKSHHVMELVRPVRDVFAAVFFVSVGTLIEPRLLAEHWVAIVLLVAVVLCGKVVAVGLGSFLAGQGSRTAVQAGMSMAQIGEFSFIIASAALLSGGVRGFLYPVAVAVSAITTLSTPWMVRSSDGIAAWFDGKLPRPMQTYSALYATWVEDIRRGPERRTIGTKARRLLLWMFVDTGALVALIVGFSVVGPRVRLWLESSLGLSPTLGRSALLVSASLLALPFMFGIFRVARGLAVLLAGLALPPQERFDRAVAPRRALVSTIELAIVLLLGLPVLLITQPFLPRFGGVAVLILVLVALGMAAWRNATNLEGHVKAGAEVLIAALSSALPPESATQEMHLSGPRTEEMPVGGVGLNERFVTATHMLPGIGVPAPFVVLESHHAVGMSLAELGVRGRTGATVLAITRHGTGIPAPSKTERIEVGDTLVLVGTRAALQSAKQLLRTGMLSPS